jgi:hypothetical protein
VQQTIIPKFTFVSKNKVFKLNWHRTALKALFHAPASLFQTHHIILYININIIFASFAEPTKQKLFSSFACRISCNKYWTYFFNTRFLEKLSEWETKKSKQSENLMSNQKSVYLIFVLNSSRNQIPSCVCKELFLFPRFRSEIQNTTVKHDIQ